MKTRRRRGAINQQDLKKQIDNNDNNIIEQLPTTKITVTFLQQVDYKMQIDSQQQQSAVTKQTVILKQTQPTIQQTHQAFKKKLRRYSGKTKQQDFDQLP